MSRSRRAKSIRNIRFGLDRVKPVAGRKFGHFLFLSTLFYGRRTRSLTGHSHFVDDDENKPTDHHVGRAMTRTRLTSTLRIALLIGIFAPLGILGLGVSARAGTQDGSQDKTSSNATQSAKQSDSKQKEVPEETASQSKRLTIEVTGGDKNVSVENASVYLKFSEGRVLRKDRKYELNVKTNRDGTAHIPDPPLGRVLIQVVADGWKSYGKYYDLADPGSVIKIHLDRPPKWY